MKFKENPLSFFFFFIWKGGWLATPSTPPGSIPGFIGYELKEAELKEVAIVSGILNISNDFLTAEARSNFSIYVPQVEDIKNDEWVDKHLYLNQRIHSSM